MPQREEDGLKGVERPSWAAQELSKRMLLKSPAFVTPMAENSCCNVVYSMPPGSKRVAEKICDLKSRMLVLEIRTVLLYGDRPFSPPGLPDDKCLYTTCIYAEIEVPKSEGTVVKGYVIIYTSVSQFPYQKSDKTLFCKLCEPSTEKKFLGRCLCSFCHTDWFRKGWFCPCLREVCI